MTDAKRDDGGAAFPSMVGYSSGLSLRDYFIAHAPAEPQMWFSASMPTPRPKHPGSGPTDLSPEERKEKEGRGEWLMTRYTSSRALCIWAKCAALKAFAT